MGHAAAARPGSAGTPPLLTPVGGAEFRGDGRGEARRDQLATTRRQPLPAGPPSTHRIAAAHSREARKVGS